MGHRTAGYAGARPCMQATNVSTSAPLPPPSAYRYEKRLPGSTWADSMMFRSAFARQASGYESEHESGHGPPPRWRDATPAGRPASTAPRWTPPADEERVPQEPTPQHAPAEDLGRPSPRPPLARSADPHRLLDRHQLARSRVPVRERHHARLTPVAPSDELAGKVEDPDGEHDLVLRLPQGARPGARLVARAAVLAVAGS